MARHHVDFISVYKHCCGCGGGGGVLVAIFFVTLLCISPLKQGQFGEVRTFPTSHFD